MTRLNATRWVQGSRAGWHAMSLFLLLAGSATHADVILDGATVTGQVGLTGETFASGTVYGYWNGGNSQVNLTNGDPNYALGVAAGQTISLQYYLHSFQNTSNAYLYGYRGNIAPLAQGEARTVDLVRAGGRVRGTVSVTGGTLLRIQMSTSVSASSTESYNGNVTVTGGAAAQQPMPALANTRVTGSATLHADAGCDIPVTLAQQTVTVPDGGIVDVAWSFDLSTEQCDLGSISGEISLSGLTGSNTDVRLTQHQITASGPVNQTAFRSSDGPYTLSGLVAGTYYLYNYANFAAPYTYTGYNSRTVAVTRGQATTQDLQLSVGTIHGRLIPHGTWSLSDTSSIQAQFSAPSGWSYDQIDRTTGAMDFVAQTGQNQLYYWYSGFSLSDAQRTGSQSLYRYHTAPTSSPARVTLAQGDRIDVGDVEFDAAEAEQGFYIRNPAVGIKGLQIQGYSYDRDPNTNATLGQTQIYYATNLRNGVNATNGVSVKLRGISGTYAMTATAQGTDGGTYSAPFELFLGEPFDTPVGNDVVQDITDPSGQSIGSVTFGTVSAAGDTTVSLSTTGPAAKPNFKIFRGPYSEYYDIRTTATFDEATVCLDYDDATLSVRQEEHLELAHQVCTDPPANTQCNWQNITSAGYPDTAANRICGVTTSFSIFAMMLPLDEDDDGVIDVEDNCPATPNEDQRDLDGDGIGNACETDTDGDGLVDDEDFCPLLASADNGDLDGDGVGDPCDADADGDDVDDAADNCPRANNPAQSDFDEDGEGDACDLDDDGDGIEDAADACAGTLPGDAIDVQGCSSAQRFAQACPVSAAYHNHGAYVSCMSQEAERQLAIGLITEDEKDAAVSTAAQSTIGKK